MSKKTLVVARQGDVPLLRVSALPKGAVEVKPENKVVLALGEVTGHHHRFEDVLEHRDAPKVRVFDFGAERFIQVMERTVLLHEEHAGIPVEPGIYRTAFDIGGGVRGTQREYSPAEIKRVVD